jgi:hypothetical protein
MIASLLLVVVQAPDVLREWPYRATTLSLMPDLDGDGKPEILAADHIHSTPTIHFAGILRVLSSTGGVLFEIVGTFRFNTVGAYTASVGDVNGDGYSDFMSSGGLSSGTSGHASVHSGRNGSTLLIHSDHAYSALPLGDINGDGIGDFLLGLGSLHLYHGGTYESRLSIPPPLGSIDQGWSAVAMGDLDRDGVVDFAVGAPGLGGKTSPRGNVYVYSGREGRLLYHLPGLASADDFGRSLASPGDFTGDGFQDLVVGAPLCCTPDLIFGKLNFYDGKNGRLLRSLDPVNGFVLGSQLDEFGDLDGNGQVDALVRMERIGSSTVSGLAIDAHSGDRFRDYNDLGFGVMVSGGYDWNDDGFPDYLTGDLSGVRLFSGAPPRTEVAGAPCGTILGRSPRIGASRAPLLGQPYEVHLSDVPPGATAVLRVGGIGKPSLLPTGGQRGCAFLGSTLAMIQVKAQKVGPNRGAATVAIPIPADPALLDQRFSLQWTVLGSHGMPEAFTRILRPKISQ